MKEEVYLSIQKRVKFITNAGKEILIDVLDTKVIYIKDVERIITYGKKNSGHTFMPTPEILIFDLQGNLIKHISPVNLSSYDVEITSRGEVFFVGAYDNNYQGSSLIKMDKNGNILWQRGLPNKFKSLDPINITVSPNGDKIAILQDRSFGNSQTLISVFGSNGDVLSKIDSNRGMRKVQFFGDDKIIVYSKSTYCFYFYDLKKKESEELKCFDSFINSKSQEPHYLFIHPKQKYFGIYQNKSNEFVFVRIDDEKLNLVYKVKISPLDLKKILSIITLDNKIEIWQKDKKIELLFKS